jgi:uncharacterized protein
MMRYRPGDEAHRLGMPVLVCVAEGDSETLEEVSRRMVERAPRGKLRRYPTTHFDFYRDPMRQRVLADQIVFLHAHLMVARNHT